MRPEHLRLDRLASPIGEVLLVTDEAGRLRALDFHDYEPRMLRLLRLHYGGQPLETGPAPAAIRAALDAYFAGAPTALGAIRWATAGTAFQRQVWTALVDIPIGQTVNYAGLAARIGRPTAVRALGAANGANPVGIVVPCHRVIGADGSLTGYGGGIERKRWLLAHEGAL
ncbi:methylated-DNA--[protein]-cysteine S-methyltransferase [Caulobacter sp. LARHSG274]